MGGAPAALAGEGAALGVEAPAAGPRRSEGPFGVEQGPVAQGADAPGSAAAVGGAASAGGAFSVDSGPVARGADAPVAAMGGSSWAAASATLAAFDPAGVDAGVDVARFPIAGRASSGAYRNTWHQGTRFRREKEGRAQLVALEPDVDGERKFNGARAHGNINDM